MSDRIAELWDTAHNVMLRNISQLTNHEKNIASNIFDIERQVDRVYWDEDDTSVEYI